MITRVVFNDKTFRLIGEYRFKFSNNEVTFNDIKIDFTGYTLADIPYKYQEIKIMELENENDTSNGKILFTGYLDDIDLSEMKLRKEEREMTLTLLSPLKMATKRSVTLIGTYELKTAIKRVLQPLIDDGFVLSELNVPDGQITTNYVLQTVEYEMNDIGFKRNIFWYINERKEIFVNSIDVLFGKPVVKTITQDVKEEGILGIQPKIENIDYANVINFKNVRLIYTQENNMLAETLNNNGYPILNIGKNIKKGDVIQFNNPIIVDEDYLREVAKNREDYLINYAFIMNITLPDSIGGYFNYRIYLDEDVFKIDEKITFSDDSGDEGEIVLQRDSFFPNLITGFKWNYNSDATITLISSDTALRYTTMRFMYSAEIERLKGIVSDSGQIEKTIDYNGRWTTLNQLIEYARSLMVQNSNTVNQINLEYDKNPNLKIGDIVSIDEPSFYTKGNFAVKDIDYTYYNEIEQIWKITLKSTDLISTYIDMFRPAEQETPTENIDSVVLSEFVEEKVNEVHELNMSNSAEHTLNFNL